MPAEVRRCGKHAHNCWVIVADGRIVGHSSTRAKAQASANARNAAKYGGWRPTGKRASGRGSKQ